MLPVYQYKTLLVTTEYETFIFQLTLLCYVSCSKTSLSCGKRVSAALSHIINPIGTMTASTDSNKKKCCSHSNGLLNKHMHFVAICYIMTSLLKHTCVVLKTVANCFLYKCWKFPKFNNLLLMKPNLMMKYKTMFLTSLCKALFINMAETLISTLF